MNQQIMFWIGTAEFAGILGFIAFCIYSVFNPRQSESDR